MKFERIIMEKGYIDIRRMAVGVILLFPDYNPPKFDEGATRKELVIKVDKEKIRTIRKFDKRNFLHGANEGDVLKEGYELKYFMEDFGGFDRTMLPERLKQEESFEIKGITKTAYEWAKEAEL
jgi:hypothetical protein